MHLLRLAIQGGLILAALLYLGMLPEAMMGFPLDPGRSYLSELAAADQDASSYFRVVDSIAGGLIVAAAIALWLTKRVATPGTGAAINTAVLALGTFGVGTIFDVIFPMACAPSGDRECAERTRAGDYLPGSFLHEAASVLADGAAVILACALAILWFKSHRSWRGTHGFADAMLIGACTVAILASAVVSVMALASPDGDLIVGTGYVQRGQTLAFCVLLTMVVPLLGRIDALGSRHRAAGEEQPEASQHL